MKGVNPVAGHKGSIDVLDIALRRSWRGVQESPPLPSIVGRLIPRDSRRLGRVFYT